MKRFIFKGLVIIFFAPSASFGAISDYIYPYSKVPSFSNYGTTGLIQMPSARLHEEGSIAISWSDADPYQRGSIVAYPFSWFEASYQYTDVNNALYSDVKAFSGDQTYKDKSFDTKFKLLSESRYLPAIAIGARDIGGTGIFSSEYIVGTKKIFNVDFTAGIGFGALSGNRIKNPFQSLDDRFLKRTIEGEGRGGEFNSGTLFSGPAGSFGGIEVFLPNLKGARLKIEYDGTDYSVEGFPFGRESFTFAFEPVKQADSRINIGFLYPLSNNVHFKLSYIKGNTLSFGFSVQAPLAKKDPLFKKNDPLLPVQNANIIRKVNLKERSYVYKSSLKYLNDRKFYLQAANIDNNKLEVVYAQSKYQSFPQSTGRVLTVLDSIAPDYIEKFSVSNTNGSLGMHTVEVDRKIFAELKRDKLHKLLANHTNIRGYEHDLESYEFQPKSKFPVTLWKLAPAIRSQIGGPDGFYFGDLRLAFHSETLFSKRLSFLNSISYGLYNTFDDLQLASDSVLPHVRTDIVKYLKRSTQFSIQRSQVNLFLNPRENLYAKFSFGLMEEMFGGIGGEVLYRPFDNNFGIGAELWSVKQRKYDMLFGFGDYETVTGHLNFHYVEPRTQIKLSLKGGKFLAKDSGIDYDLSRRFKSGLQMGVFLSQTDISKQEYGEGSFKKGFYFHIPVQIFFDKFAKGTAGFGLMPTTRDGAIYLIHSHPLWGVTEQANRQSLARDWDDVYD